MIYTLDDDLFRYQVESFAKGPHSERIWMGTGSWLFSSRPARAVAQLEAIREAGSTGEVIFSYDALLESEPLLAALRGDPSPQASPAAPAREPGDPSGAQPNAEQGDAASVTKP
jgi:hypothetical protein